MNVQTVVHVFHEHKFSSQIPRKSWFIYISHTTTRQFLPFRSTSATAKVSTTQVLYIEPNSPLNGTLAMGLTLAN